MVSTRRGRPRVADAEAHRDAVIDAAFAELVDRGYRATTMLGIARRAGASKETLYAWFGSKQGLFSALVRRQAAATASGITGALDADDEPRTVLTGFAEQLLGMLVGERSLAINRAAMTSPDLADVLLREGRHTAGPIVERYLAHIDDRGALCVPDPVAAFRLLYGLVIEDTQIRSLLGEPPPNETEIAARASTAVDRFIRLLGPRATEPAR